MPSAGRDGELRARFLTDIGALLGAAGLAPDAPLGIALSGGPDSCALLVLAHGHAAGPVSAMTVDHGLRTESAAEAAVAAALCAAIGVQHETARVTLSRPSQATARAARYDALGDWAARTGLAAVLTAHHADDQAETLLMRLARGAGLAGLAGVRAIRPLRGDVLLLRPLLGWRKAELAAIVADAGIDPARDPSNHDPRYDRTAARALLGEADWIDPLRVAASAGHLAEAEAALAALADQRYRVESRGDDLLYHPDPLREIARRHLRRLLAERFGVAPDGPALERALGVLTDGGGTTCADILCDATAVPWTFRRAPPRRPTAPAS